jgi:translation initiation factor 1 (eIF-1/SUI1)
MILLSNEEIKIEEVLEELKARFGTSGHVEKASRVKPKEEK